MATRDANTYDLGTVFVAQKEHLRVGFLGFASSSPSTMHFKMIGQSAVNSDHDTWLVVDSPDFTGAQYTGPLATPLRNISIASKWTV